MRMKLEGSKGQSCERLEHAKLHREHVKLYSFTCSLCSFAAISFYSFRMWPSQVGGIAMSILTSSRKWNCTVVYAAAE